MKFFHNIYIAFLVLLLSLGVFIFSVYHYCFSGTSDDNSLKTVEIKLGSSIDSIATILDEKGFIRNKLAFKAYVKLTDKTNLKAGVYSLSKDMGLIEIVNVLEKGGRCSEAYKITFKEGINVRKVAKIIAENTNNTEEMVYDTLKNKEYLRELIDKYWFLSNDILNDNIYYSLEGYLYPSTYHFCSKDTSVEIIIEAMLDEMENKLEDYKKQIIDNDKGLHELLTLASIVELEGVTLEDRKGIAQVLYNRLDKNMSLGCDVTTYYGARVDMGERDLYQEELKECNGYNTRCATFKGLPVSPISNPSFDSIVATLEPNDNNYLYFLADKNRKIYFSKTYSEHQNTEIRLKRDGLWYEY